MKGRLSLNKFIVKPYPVNLINFTFTMSSRMLKCYTKGVIETKAANKILENSEEIFGAGRLTTCMLFLNGMKVRASF